MSKFYSYNDIEKVVLSAGFKLVKNNGGSHQMYKDEFTGLGITIPKHPDGVSVGTGESILELSVLNARIENINIGAKSNKFNRQIGDFIVSHQAKCKKNILLLLPNETIIAKNLDSPELAEDYLQRQINICKKNHRELDY